MTDITENTRDEVTPEDIDTIRDELYRLAFEDAGAEFCPLNFGPEVMRVYRLKDSDDGADVLDAETLKKAKKELSDRARSNIGYWHDQIVALRDVYRQGCPASKKKSKVTVLTPAALKGGKYELGFS